jgi:hypothetical protein
MVKKAQGSACCMGECSSELPNAFCTQVITKLDTVGTPESRYAKVAFAKRISRPVATLRDWEQARFKPPGRGGVPAQAHCRITSLRKTGDHLTSA